MTENKQHKSIPRRHLKNYLIDKKFQLYYALAMVLISSVLTGFLGYLVFHQAQESKKLQDKQANETVKLFNEQASEIIRVLTQQAQYTTKVFTEQSNRTKEVFKKKTQEATEILKLLQGDPDLKKMADEMLAKMKKDDQEAINKQIQLIEAEKKKLQAKTKSEIDRKLQQLATAKRKLEKDKQEAAKIRYKNIKNILIGLIFFALLFIVVIFLYTIVLTHKVAGPLFKISKYFERMENNDLGPIYPLRKGDQLQEFYYKFEKAHNSVVKRQKEDIKILSEVIESLGDTDSETVNKLKALKEFKEKAIYSPDKD